MISFAVLDDARWGLKVKIIGYACQKQSVKMKCNDASTLFVLSCAEWIKSEKGPLLSFSNRYNKGGRSLDSCRWERKDWCQWMVFLFAFFWAFLSIWQVTNFENSKTCETGTGNCRSENHHFFKTKKMLHTTECNNPKLLLCPLHAPLATPSQSVQVSRFHSPHWFEASRDHTRDGTPYTSFCFAARYVHETWLSFLNIVGLRKRIR